MKIETVVAAAVLFLGCQPAAKGDPVLTVAIDGKCTTDGPQTVRVVATDATGNVGKGTIQITRTIGGMTATDEVTLDSFGTASFTFTCTGCTDDIEVEARWQTTGSLPIYAKRVCEFDRATSIPAMCVVGSATTRATANDLSLFGTPVYFANHADLPAGEYRVANAGGCMKYGPGQNWMTQAWEDGSSAWWLIGANTTDRKFMLPGVFGWTGLGGTPRDVGDANFSTCVSKNRASPSKTFTHTGGPLGIMLVDAIYSDNTSGEMDQNPAWVLTHVNADCP
ncbi:MAG: hypothetical protein QM817_17690 [Archangium sp.]